MTETELANGKQNVYDMVVVGGGVIGLSIAYRLARNNHRVAIVESKTCGGSSSWAGAGMLPSPVKVATDDPIESLRAFSHRLHQQWTLELLEQTGIDNEFHQCGGVYLARTRVESATMAAQEFFWDEMSVPYESISPIDAQQKLHCFSNELVEQLPGAWWLPEDCQIRNPRHLTALKSACLDLGVQIHENTQVVDIKLSGERATKLETNRGEFACGSLCIANGSWAPLLLGTQQIRTGVYPVRGQMLLYELESSIFSFILNDGHRYLVPRRDGKLLVGSCEEEVGYDDQITEEKCNELAAWATEVLPQLRDQNPQRRWAGLRPGSFDGLPYIGALDRVPNLYLATGHFRHGLHWSTGTAELICEMYENRTPSINTTAFTVNRGKTALKSQS